MPSDDHSGERRRRRRRRRHSSSGRHDREERYDRDEQIVDEDSEGGGRSRRPESFGRLLGFAIIAVVAVVLVGGGVWYYYRTTSPTARALAELRAMPLVGLVIADQPGVESRLKAAIEDEARNPSTTGPSRPLMVVAQLRGEFIAPAVRAADDASLIAAMAARAELVGHLRKTNTAACREFSLGGIQHVDKLDAEGQRLFKNVLTAMEAAYRSGHAAGKAPPMPTLQDIGAMLTEAGFVKPDFDKLNSFATLSNEVSCDIELKINQVPAKLPTEKRGAYSRYILGN